jgi:hypothetical protein
MADGGTLCHKCLVQNYDQIKNDTIENNPYDTQWCLYDVSVNWEDNEMYCDNCNTKLNPEYGE